MAKTIWMLTVACALAACGDNTGTNAKQGPQAVRQDTPASTASQQCEQLEGSARDECMRQARESGTSTPSIATSADKPSAAAAGGTAAQAERGSGVEGATSAGTTTGGSQQPLSTGSTTR